jgi:hypothetical protein
VSELCVDPILWGTWVRSFSEAVTDILKVKPGAEGPEEAEGKEAGID